MSLSAGGSATEAEAGGAAVDVIGVQTEGGGAAGGACAAYRVGPARALTVDGVALTGPAEARHCAVGVTGALLAVRETVVARPAAVA